MSNWYPIRWAEFNAYSRDGTSIFVQMHDEVYRGEGPRNCNLWFEEADGLFTDPWEMGAEAGRVSVTNQGPRELPFTLVSLKDDGGQTSPTQLIKTANLALGERVPGKFTIALGESDKPFEISGYLVHKGVTDFDKRKGLQRHEMALVTTDNYWYRASATLTADDVAAGIDTTVTSGLGADLYILSQPYPPVSPGVSLSLDITADLPGSYPSLNWSNRYAGTVPAPTDMTRNLERLEVRTASRSFTYRTDVDFIEMQDRSAYEYREGGAAGSGEYIFEPLPRPGIYTFAAASAAKSARVTIYERYGAPQW